MPEIVNCPDCGRKLRIPDAMIGKKVQCPSCCVKFKAAIAGSEPEELEEVPDEAPRAKSQRAGSRDERISTGPQRSARRRDEDEEEDRPRSRRRRDEEDEEDEDRPRSRRRRSDEQDDPEEERRKWEKVRYGIQLVAIGTWVWIMSTILGGIFLLLGLVLGFNAVTSFDPSSAGSSVASLGIGAICLMAGAGIMALGKLIELILRAVGYGLCMATPNKEGTGLKPLAITAFVLVAVNIFFTVGGVFVNGFSSLGGGFSSMALGRAGAQAGAQAGSSLLGFSSVLVVFASFAVFLFFLRSISRHVRDRQLGGKMITVLIVFISYYLVSGLIVVALIFATVGGTLFSLSSGSDASRAANAAGTLGTMVVISIVVFCLVVLGNLGLHAWYVSLLQKVRAAIDGHRRDLME